MPSRGGAGAAASSETAAVDVAGVAGNFAAGMAAREAQIEGTEASAASSSKRSAAVSSSQQQLSAAVSSGKQQQPEESSNTGSDARSDTSRDIAPTTPAV